MTESAAALALSSVAIAQSSANQQAIKELKCEVIIKDFNSKTSNIEQQKEYANCIYFKYPDEIDISFIIYFKVVFVICLISGIFGLIKDLNDNYEILSSILSFFMWFILTGLFCGALTAIFYGVVFVFS